MSRCPLGYLKVVQDTVVRFRTSQMSRASSELIVTIEKIATTPNKIRICLRDGDGTCVENLRLSHIRKTRKPKGSQENKDFPTFQIRSSSCCDFIVWRGWKGQEENVCSNFSPRLIGFLSSSAFVSRHYLLCIFVVKCLAPSPFPVLGACWEAFCRRGSEGVVKKEFEGVQENWWVFFFFFYVVNIHNIQFTWFRVLCK